MIVDGHCHLGKGDGFTGPWDTEASVEKYLRRAATAGIDRTIAFPPFHSNYAVANQNLSRIVKKRPSRFIGFAFIHARRDAGRVKGLVATAVEEYGFRGIKVHRHDARLSREICEVAGLFRIPVLYDPMGETAQIELFATEFPEVVFIIPHLGSFADDWRAQRVVIDQISRHRNVYTDTSGLRRFDLLVEAVRRAGANKVIFGSDGPWLHPAVERAKITMLQLNEAAERKILGENILRILGMWGGINRPKNSRRPLC